MTRCWAILTGAYPPAPGGVSDYTRVVARALVRAGDDVHVFAPRAESSSEIVQMDEGVHVRLTSDGYTSAGFRALGGALDRLPPDREILVQYTPYAFAARGVNVILPLWLNWRRRNRPRERVTVMFHEVMYPIRRGQPLRHNLLGAAHGLAAMLLARAASRALVSTPRWGDLVRRMMPIEKPIEWAPVPSSLPTVAEEARVTLIRATIAPDGQALVGHFGTYGRAVLEILRTVILEVLRANRTSCWILVGRGSREFAETLIARDRSLRERVVATGEADPCAVVDHLAACDVLVQPYPDGVTTRRSSVMAGLALGAAVVTNAGELTEPLWRESGAVELAASPDVRDIVAAVQRLLCDPSRRHEIGARARTLYETRFAVERTIEVLRADVGQDR